MTNGETILELYHALESICSERVRMTLYEKKILDWIDHPILLFKGEQFDPEYVKLNPKAQVPTLVHNGHVVRESSIVCNYIDDVFPQPLLKPESPQARACMQEWIKNTDEALYQSVSSLSFSMVFCERLNAMSKQSREAHFAKQTDIERIHRQRSCIKHGTRSPYVLRAVVAWEKMLSEIEITLQEGGPWLMGEQYSLVEIALGPFIARIQDLQILPIWMEGRPLSCEWWGRVQQRPSFVQAQVGVGLNDIEAYKQAGKKYGSEIKELHAWYLKDPVACGQAFQFKE
jgi:glutathione S-transferase